MRLLNTSTLQLERFSSTESTPPYAILSHTWGKDSEEVSYDDMKSNPRLLEIERRYGFQKVKMTCQLARKVYGLDYAWVDTCCIDQSSSAELSEAINSMFKWYHRAVVCLAFLADWQPDDENFAHCKWFTRGWTLQELVASKVVIFYDSTWQARGDKLSLRSELSKTTRIQEDVLAGETDLPGIPVAVRMSWASERVTTREEDIAYCLLGIFDSNMPMLYGEGHKAFRRLQEEIIKENADMSIFAWRALPGSSQDYMGIIAPSPKEFLRSNLLYPAQAGSRSDRTCEFSVSNRGVKFLLPGLRHEEEFTILPVLHYNRSVGPKSKRFSILTPPRSCGVYLRKISPQSYVRALPSRFAEDSTWKLFQISDEQSPVTVPKSISVRDSENIGQRAIHVLEPSDLLHPDFRLANPLLRSNWDATSRTLYATGNGYFHHQFQFDPEWSSVFSSFTIMCRFIDSRGTPFPTDSWQCAAVSGIRQSPSSSSVFGHGFPVLSSHQPGSFKVETTLVLPHVRDMHRSKRIVLWLQKKQDALTEPAKFFMGIQVHDG